MNTQQLADDKMYTIKDIQEIFQISHTTAYTLINSNTFPKITINKRHYVPKSKLDKWISQNLHKQIEM